MLVPAITLFGRAGLDLALLTVNDDMSSLSRDGCKEPKSIRLKQQSRDTNNVSCHGYIYIYITQTIPIYVHKTTLTAFAKVTNPNPRLRLVNRSTMTTESTTGPN